MRNQWISIILTHFSQEIMCLFDISWKYFFVLPHVRLHLSKKAVLLHGFKGFSYLRFFDISWKYFFVSPNVRLHLSGIHKVFTIITLLLQLNNTTYLKLPRNLTVKLLVYHLFSKLITPFPS